MTEKVYDTADALIVDEGKSIVWNCSKCGTPIYGSDIGMTFAAGCQSKYTKIQCPNRDCRHIDKVGEVRMYGRKPDGGFSDYSKKLETIQLKAEFAKKLKGMV